MTTLDAASQCRNCGAAATRSFCPECGQDTAPHPPSAREFLHEFVGHYVAVEGKLWKTLAMLLRPGRLTLEYLAGRKSRYVAPLRLYLTASVVFFLAVKVFPPEPAVRVLVDQDGRPAVIECTPGNKACRRIDAFIQQRLGSSSSAELMSRVRQGIVQDAPYAMFVLLPLFALLTRIAYRRRPLNYGEHLVLAFHVHAFAFLLGAIAAPAHAVVFAVLLTGAYLGVATRRIFGGRMLPWLLRLGFVSIVYAVALELTLITIAAISVIA